MANSDHKGPFPTTHFVVLGHPRSGSTLLISTLREHPAIRIYGELFHHDEAARRAAFRGDKEVYRTGTDGMTFLDKQIFGPNWYDKLRAIGFKLFYDQAHDEGARSVWDYLLRRTDIKVVHLIRENPLDIYVSYLEALTSGRWTLDNGCRRPEDAPPVQVNPEHCLDFLDSLYAYRTWVRTAFAGHQVHELFYQRHLVADFDRQIAEVQSFLGLRVRRLPMLMQKQATRPLAQRVSNIDEITAMLRHTIHSENVGE